MLYICYFCYKYKYTHTHTLIYIYYFCFHSYYLITPILVNFFLVFQGLSLIRPPFHPSAHPYFEFQPSHTLFLAIMYPSLQWDSLSLRLIMLYSLVSSPNSFLFFRSQTLASLPRGRFLYYLLSKNHANLFRISPSL